MSRRARAVASVDSLPDAPPHRTRFYRDTIFRRIRSGAATAFFGGLSSIARLVPMSKPERHGVEVEHDVIYGPHGDWNTLDIYRPVHRPKPWPVVFYVHGGAFHLLSKDTHWLMGLVFARFGYLCVNISYRLAPKHPYPAAVEDTCAAYRWLNDNIEELGGDRNRVAVAGESAGGNLITALALAACQPRPEPWAKAVYDLNLVPRAVMPFCAILEVTRPERFSQRKPNLPFWVDGMLRDAAMAYLHQRAHEPSVETELADPIRVLEAAAGVPHELDARFPRGLPPFFAPVGTRDPLLDDTRRLEAALRTLGVPVEARYYSGGIHAFHALVWDPAARRCWRDALAFLDRHMR